MADELQIKPTSNCLRQNTQGPIYHDRHHKFIANILHVPHYCLPFVVASQLGTYHLLCGYNNAKMVARVFSSRD